jgi:hypothetical protein
VAVSDWVPIAQLAGGIIAAAGLIVSSCALWFNGEQLRRSRRTADLQALQKFADDATKREASLAEAEDDRSREHAFNEFLNFLELYSCAYNNRLFNGLVGSEDLVRHKIIDSYLELEAATEWHDQVIRALDRATTFIELKKLVGDNTGEADERREQMKYKAERDRRRSGV